MSEFWSIICFKILLWPIHHRTRWGRNENFKALWEINNFAHIIALCSCERSSKWSVNKGKHGTVSQTFTNAAQTQKISLDHKAEHWVSEQPYILIFKSIWLCFRATSSVFSTFSLFLYQVFYFSTFTSVLLISLCLYKGKCQRSLSKTKLSTEVHSWPLGSVYASVYCMWHISCVSLQTELTFISCTFEFYFFQAHWTSSFLYIEILHYRWRVLGREPAGRATVTSKMNQDNVPLLWHRNNFNM